jgi:hypothetical protein
MKTYGATTASLSLPGIYMTIHSQLSSLGGAPIPGLMVPPVAGIDVRTLNMFAGGANTMSDHVASILQV